MTETKKTNVSDPRSARGIKRDRLTEFGDLRGFLAAWVTFGHILLFSGYTRTDGLFGILFSPNLGSIASGMSIHRATLQLIWFATSSEPIAIGLARDRVAISSAEFPRICAESLASSATRLRNVHQKLVITSHQHNDCLKLTAAVAGDLMPLKRSHTFY